MKNLLQRFFLFGVVALLASVALNAQVQIGPINYPTLKAAFDAINNGVHTGNITINITGNTVETATAVLNRSGSGAASYTAVNIYTSGVDTVYGDASISPVVRFADADNITIDGRVGQTGSTNSLTFASLNTGATIIWIDSTAGGNGAKNILIRNVNILGASATTTSYGINVSSSSSQSTGAPGFDNIQILYCNFARTYYGINIRGGSNAAQYATNITVRFNNFGQNATPGMSNYYGIYMYYVQAPVIKNNYFSYNTTTYLYTLYLYYTNLPEVADNTMENVSSTSTVYFLYMNYGNNLTAYNNIIRNINSSGGAFYGVYNYYSPAPIITNNRIEDINITSTFYGYYIYHNSSSPSTAVVQSNVIRNAFTSTGTAYGLYGYYINNGLFDGNIFKTITGYYTVAGMYLSSVTNSRFTNNFILNINQTYASNTYYQVGMLFLSSCNNDTIANNAIARIQGNVTSANSAQYSPSGIQIQGGANWAIWHNSVYMNGTHANDTQILPAALTVTSTSATNLDIRNNVFVNSYVSPNATSKSYAIYLAGTANISTIDYNDYYVSGPNAMLGFLGADAADIMSWRGLSGQDVNSISANPVFNGLTNLLPYTGSPLVAAGTPIAQVTSDILGVTRSTTTPTIGAYEEAGDIDTPEVFFTNLSNIGAGVPSRTLVATISDVSGVDTTNMPRLYFRKSSNANTFVDNTNATNGWKYAVATSLGGDQYQFVIDHNLIFGGLAIGDTVQYFIVASDNFTNPHIGVYGATLASQVTSVALAATDFPATSPSYFYRVLPSFSGDIEVGAGQTYTTLTGSDGIFAALNNAVLVGNVTIKIVSDIDEPGTVALGEISSSGGVYSITIRPWGAPRTLSFNKDGACLLFNGTDRLTIDGRLSGFQGNALTITNTVRTATHQVIFIAGTATNGATNITIRNVNIRAGHPAINNTTNSYGILVATSSVGQVATNHNISLLENKIERAYYAIRIMGASPGLNGIVISKNYIGNDIDSLTVTYRGIHLENTNSAQITYNTLRNIKINTSTNIAAIDLASGTINNTYIYGNKIQGVANPASGGWGAYGINVASSATYNTYILNNMISDVTIMNYSNSSNTYNPFGIRVTGGIGYYVYHNTIDMSGTMANVGSSASMSACVLVTSTSVDSVFVRNNIFVNRTIHNIGGSYSYIYYLPSSTWTGVKYCDYNHYYVGGNYPYFAYSGSAIQTFDAWKAAVTPIDSNSTYGNVTFVGVRNAYIGGPSVGDPLLIKPTFTGMPDEDIDGEFRDPLTNYAGADIAVPTGFDIAEDLPFTLLKGGDPFTLAFQPIILGFVDEVDRGVPIGDANIYEYEWFYNNVPLASTPGVREVNRNTVEFINPAANLSGDYYATVSYGGTTLTTNVCQLTIDPLQPTLLAPANDTDDQPLTVMLQWTNVAAATSYQVQISTSPLFTTTVFDTIVTDNFVVPSGLTYSTTYFWRVAGRQGTTAGLWTQPWAFTTRVAIYPCVLVSPANGQTFVEVNPVLTWLQNVDASSYRVQISTDIAFQNIVLDTTTTDFVYTSPVTLQYLTTYFWRVQGLNPPYQSDWSEIREFFTRPAIYTPTLVYPANNATKIPVNPRLRWNVANGATSYNLVVWKDSINTTPIVNTVVADTSYLLQNLYGETDYFWQVQGLNPTHQSDWSAINKFTTKIIFWGPVVQDTITVGTITTTTSNYPFFTYWMDSRMQTIMLASELGSLTGTITAIAYNVESFSTQPMYGFTVKMKNTTATAVGTEFDNVGLTTVYYNNGEIVSATGWKYIQLQTPFAYDLTKNLLIDICFDNTSYDSYSYVYSHTTTTNLTLHRYADLSTGNGCVDLTSTNSGGVKTDRPTTRIIGYADGWLSPKQYIPQNNAINVEISPATAFVWGSLEDASSYQIQVATDSNFTNILIDVTTADTTLNATNLSYITTYYWRVRGVNIHQNSVWSATRKFTTRPAIFPVVLIAPINGAQYIPITQNFVWHPETNATEYQLQVSTSPTFATTLLDYTTADTNYVYTTIQNATIYWRVRGLNATNTGEWSAVWSFTTIPNIYPPIPLDPFSGATDVNPSPEFVWTAISNATGYSFEIASDPLFNTLIDSYTGADTTYRVWGLEGGTTYYWRVRAFNSTDVSDWSGTSSFTTVNMQADVQIGTIGTTSSYQIPINRWYDHSISEIIYLQSEIGSGQKTIKSIAYYKMSGTDLNPIDDIHIYMRHTTATVATTGTVLASTTAPYTPVATDYQRVYSGNFPNDSVTGWMKVDLDSFFVYNGVDNLQILVVKGFQSYTSNRPYYATFTPGATMRSAYQYEDGTMPNDVPYTMAAVPVTRFEFVSSSVDAPTLLSPPNNDINRPTTNNLVWDVVPGTVYYRVQLATDAAFSNLLVNELSSTTNYVVTGLDSGATYFWRVKAIHDTATSAWSAVWKFTTAYPQLSAPILLTPPNNAVHIPFNASIPLGWQAVPYSTEYHIQVSLDTFNTVLAEGTFDASITQVFLNNSAAGTTYWWRVRAINPSDTSDWSDIWNFTTLPVLVAPTLVSPADSAMNVPVMVQFAWDPVIPNAGYHIQVTALPNGFANLIVDDTVATEDYTVLLQPNTEYLWRVRTLRSDGVSPWSDVRYFKTVGPITQTFPLMSGWNMISANVEPLTTSVPTLLAPLSGNLQIMRNHLGQTYVPPFTNTLSTWNKYYAYQLRLTTSQQFEIEGAQIVPETTPITLNTLGWYWLPYYRTSAAPVATALATISGKYLQVKTITGQVYMPPFANTLTQLEPGKGYMIRLTADDGVLTYPANGPIKATAATGSISEPRVFARPNVSTGKNAFIALDLDLRDGDEVGVFTRDGLLVGSSVWQQALRGVVVWGDDEFTSEKDGAYEGEELIVKVWSRADEAIGSVRVAESKDLASGVRSYSLRYETDAIVMLKGGVEFEEVGLTITPQPASTELYITLGKVSDDGVVVEIYNQSGRLMMSVSEKAPNGVMKLNVSDLPSGVYNAVIRSGATTMNERVVIVR